MFLGFCPTGNTLIEIWTFPWATKLQLPGHGLHTPALAD